MLPNSFTAAVGGAVTFTTTMTQPETPFMIVVWSFSDINGAQSTNVITSTTADVIGPAYTDRITLFKSTGSLEIRNLTLSDNGEYSISIIPNGGAQLMGNCRLVIHGM